MKTCLSPVRWMLIGAAALLPAVAGAQMPFSSTQSPGANPFNRSSTALPPTPAPRQNNPSGYANNGSMPGNYPMGPAVAPLDPDHKLGPRDRLSYSVAEDRDNEAHVLTVTDSGEVLLPLGSMHLKASGKTTQQLTADIKGALEREYYKPGHATVSLNLIEQAQGTSKGKVYITGEVNSKGALDLPVNGDLTVIQAILQLGGFTQDADLKGVYIYRKGGPKDGIRVNGKAVLNGERDKDVVLQPEDTIKVKKRFIGVSM